jgi:flavorubredoxin
MNPRKISENIYLLGAIDWDRTLFDSLIPLPQGTSYNSYLIQGSEKTVLIDTVEPDKAYILLNQLQHFPKIDYIISLHAEQDHSGTIPQLLERYPDAQVYTSVREKPMLTDLMPELDPERISTVKDGDTLSIGDFTFEFIYTPWVHWPETMSAYLREKKYLFSCDFFGAHLATSEMFANEDPLVLASNKLYYAQIMQPLRNFVAKNLEKVNTYDIEMILPSHGPIYNVPSFVLDAYEEWVNGPTKNEVVIPYVSMHHSTLKMVEHLMTALTDRGIQVQPFNLTIADLGQIAMSMVDASTIILASPTLLGNTHPLMANAIAVAALLKPKAHFIGFIGSYGWSDNVPKKVADMVAPLHKEALPFVNFRGFPTEEAHKQLDELADIIHQKHHQLGVIN